MADGEVRLDNTTTQRLLAALDDVGVGVLVGAGHRVVAANRSLARMIAGEDTDLVGREIATLLSPPSRSLVAEAQARAGDGPSHLVRPIELVTDDGVAVPAQLGLHTDLGAPGAHAVAVVVDQRDAAEARRSVEQLRTLITRAPMGIIAWDGDGVTDPLDLRMAWMNDTARQVVGRQVEPGSTLSEVFPAVQPDNAARLLDMVGTNRVEAFPEAVTRDPDRTLGVYRWRAVAVPGNLVVAIFEDVTGERAAEVRRRQLLEHLVDIGDQQRRDLAMKVHDDPIQQLAAAAMLVEALRRHPDHPDRSARLESIDASVHAALSSLRLLLFELSPPELVESGLASALSSAADYLFADGTVEIAVRTDLDRALAAETQVAAFRIATEALRNVHKHAGATHVAVAGDITGDDLHLTIADDGCGIADGIGPRPGHLGLTSMYDRAEALGGHCAVRRREPSGTLVEAYLPVRGRDHDEADSERSRIWMAASTSEVEGLRDERDSLTVAAAENRRRAHLAEARLHALDELRRLAETAEPGDGDIGNRVAHVIGRTLRDGCAITRLDTDTATLVPWGCWHPDPAQLEFFATQLQRPRPADESYRAVALRTGDALILDSSNAGWLPSDGEPLPFPIDLRATIIAPMRSGGVAVGTLNVMRDLTTAPFDSDDGDFAQVCAAVVAPLLGPSPSAAPRSQ